MAKPKIYLAGSMAGRVTKEVIAERKKASKACRKAGMLPLDPGFSEIADWTGYRISDTMSLAKMAKYVKKDLKLIRRADGLIKLTGDKASDGTDYEKDYAKFIGLPVAIVGPARFSGKLMGFSNVLFPIFPTMKAAFKWLRKELK
jgi:nucleoside 2-deoxyribosyltransferase